MPVHFIRQYELVYIWALKRKKLVFGIMVTQVLVYCLYDAFFASILCTTKVGFRCLGAVRSQKEPYQETIGDEEAFQIHIQSQQSWQLVRCRKGHCPSLKSRTPQISFPRLFLAFSCCSRLNSPAYYVPFIVGPCSR